MKWLNGLCIIGLLSSCAIRTVEKTEPGNDDTVIVENDDFESDSWFSDKIRLIDPDVKLKPGEKLEVTLKIPGIGDVVFKSAEKEGAKGMEIALPFPQVALYLGPFVIQPGGTFKMIDGVLSYTGEITCNFLGKEIKARMGLRKLKFKDSPKNNGIVQIEQCVFGIKFLDGSSKIELIPGLPIEAKALDLILSTETAPRARIKGLVFNQPVLATFELDLKNKVFTSTGKIGPCQLVTIAPFVKNTFLEDLSFGGEWNISTKKEVHFQGSLFKGNPEEKATISLLPGFTGSLDSITFDINEDKSAAVTLSATFQDAPITLSGTYDPNSKELVLKGKLIDLSIAKVIPLLDGTEFAKLDFHSTIQLSNKSGLLIKGSLKGDKGENVEIYGVKLKKGKVSFNTDKKRLEVYGIIDAFNLPASGVFAIDWGKNAGVIFSAGFDEKVTEWKPFAELAKAPGMETLRDFTIYDPRLRADLTLSGKPKTSRTEKKDAPETATISINELKSKGMAGSVDIGGTVKIGGIDCRAFVKAEKGLEKEANIVAYVSLPKGLNFVELLPKKEKFEGSDAKFLYGLLTFIKIDDGKLLLALKGTEVEGISFRPGLSIDTTITVGETIQDEFAAALRFLKDIITKTGEKGAGFHLQGQIDFLNPKNLSVRAGCSMGDFGFTIPQLAPDVGPFTFKAGALEVVLHGDGLGIEAGFDFVPGKDQQPIKCAGELSFTTTAVAIDLSAAGKWKNPFGLEKLFQGGFEIGNLGFKITETYEALASSIETFGASLLAIGALGVSGEIQLGKKDPLYGKVFFTIGTDISNFAFEISIKNTKTIGHLFNGLLEQMNIKIDVMPLFFGNVKEASLKIMPFEGRIGNIQVAKGIEGTFYGEVFDLNFGAKFSLDTNGIIARGKLPKLIIGPLEMSSYDGKGEPQIDITAHLQEGVKFLIDGRLKVADLINTKSIIKVALDGIAFDTETAIGPKDAGLYAHVKGVTLDFNDPLKLLKQIQPKELGLTIEFTNTLSDNIIKGIDNEFALLSTNLEKTYQQFVEQSDRGTTDADIQTQEGTLHQAEAAKRPGDIVVEWAKLRYLYAKRDLEKAFDPRGDVREFMKRIGMTRLVQDIFRTITYGVIDVVRKGRADFNKAASLVIIKRVYWNGNLDDVAKGFLAGIQLEGVIGGKEKRMNLGDLDLTSPEGFNASLARISLNAAKLAADLIEEILHVKLNLPACAPSVLVEAQNQREDLTVMIKDHTNVETKVPYKFSEGYQGYTALDIMCQRNLKTKAPDDKGNVETSYVITVNDRKICQVRAVLGPVEKEKILVFIDEYDKDGNATQKISSDGYGTIFTIFTPKGIPQFMLSAEVIREGLQNKIKLYFQDPFARCPSNANVEFQNQRKDLTVTVRDDYSRKMGVPQISKQPYIIFDRICQEKESDAEKKYTVTVNGKDVAQVVCTVGSGKNEFLKAKILDLDGKTLVAGGNYETIRADLTVTDVPQLTLKGVLIKESGINKFKWYVQEVFENCPSNANVEFQNQRNDLSVVVRDEYSKTMEVPYSWKQAYVIFDRICQAKESDTEKKYIVGVNGKDIAQVVCTVGSGKNEFLKAKILDFEGKTLVAGGNYETIKADLMVSGVPRLTLKGVLIKESGINKFKWYLQEVFENCAAKALVEFQNQNQNVSIRVRDSYGKAADVPHVSKQAYVGFDAICQHPTNDTSQTYTLSANGSDLMKIECILGPSKNETLETKFFDKDGNIVLGGRSFETIFKDFTLSDGKKVRVKMVPVREGSAKFKTYIQQP